MLAVIFFFFFYEEIEIFLPQQPPFCFHNPLEEDGAKSAAVWLFPWQPPGEQTGLESAAESMWLPPHAQAAHAQITGGELPPSFKLTSTQSKSQDDEQTTSLPVCLLPALRLSRRVVRHMHTHAQVNNHTGRWRSDEEEEDGLNRRGAEMCHNCWTSRGWGEGRSLEEAARLTGRGRLKVHELMRQHSLDRTKKYHTIPSLLIEHLKTHR